MLAVLALGACSSDDDQVASPTPSATSASPSPSASSASPSPSPSESGPDIPAAARKQTPAGAEAFVRYFFAQLESAWTTPESGLIAALSIDACHFCEVTEGTARYLVDHGQRYASDPVDVRDVRVFGGAPPGQQYLSLTMVQRRASIESLDGEVVKTDTYKELPRYATLRWANSRWVMLEVEKT
ncbi:hypothetical protein H9L10_07410 [Phycicoccus endophyticus]|uniref:DUF6318 domain-containing protein n=1 Tax=Phycicoccus endophyticus TaxID=1690220 RepID=A0A7G9R575_9MICO|nr:DUF6318 family protein [Phycicoccus endophyticus]NHI20646.1 hypothetical protein [Phycicoccus endophyticus]QNN50750.1 hypothetical protein H9L10_07410 [Phycicoccus endophyticus]